MRTLKIIGAVLAVLIVVNLIGRQAERDVADQRDYDKIRSVDLAAELNKFAERQKFFDGIKQ